MTSPSGGFNDSSLNQIFTKKVPRFAPPTTTMTTTSASVPPSPPPNSPPSPSHAGAIAGGVVGGILVASLIGALLYFCLSRGRKRNQQQVTAELPYNDQPLEKELSAETKPAELSNAEPPVGELDGGVWGELDGGARHELPSSSDRRENM